MHFSTSLRAAVTVGALMLAAACGGATESPAPAQQEPLFKPIELPTPATVADTPGVARYWGVLPCADCAGIRHELVLVQDGGQKIQAYVQDNIDPLLNACYLLFQAVASDLAPRAGELTREEALAHALGYFDAKAP